MKNINTVASHGYTVGEAVTFYFRPKWYVRLYRWLFRIKEKPAQFVVTSVSETTFEYDI